MSSNSKMDKTKKIMKTRTVFNCEIDNKNIKKTCV